MYLFIINCCWHIGNAQRLNFGLKGGVGFSKISGKGMAKMYCEAYSTGIYSTIDLDEQWRLQIEVEYNPVDLEASTDFRTYYVANSKSSGYEGKSRLYKLNFPVLINYKLSEHFSLQFGPQYSHSMATKEHLLKNNQSAFLKNDFVLVAGGQLNSSSFFFNLRYHYGVKNVNAINDYYSWHSRQIQLGVGVKLFSNEK